VRTDISTSMRTIGIVLVFAMMAMIVAAYPLSRIFVDDFTGVIDMGNLIIAFALGTVPFSMVLVLQRTFYSLEDTRTVFFIVFAKSLLLVAGLLLVALLPVHQIGLAVALLTSVISFVFFGIAFIVLRRRLGPIGGRLVSLRFLQYLAAGVVSAVFGVAVMMLLGGYRADGFALASWFSALVAIAVVGTVMGAVYLAALAAMRNPELRVLGATLRSRLGRGRSE
jgi:putative peptidoglycan lipid II flippase